MPEVIFKAFLSCSFAHEDKDIIALFDKLIRSFDIEPQIYDYQEIGRIPDKVKEHIIKSDCLIAIVTRCKKLEGSEYWACADWIQHEIALANAYNKPIAIFVEEGIKLDGFIAMEERRQTFIRDNLMVDFNKIVAFLFSLRKTLDSMYQMEQFQAPVLLRHYVHAKGEIISNEITVLRSEILMESLVDELEATHHSVELEDATQGLSVRMKQFDFTCLEKPSSVTVEAITVLNTDQKGLWKVVFDPPLKKSEKVKYAFKVTRPNYRPWTYEELLDRIDRGTYEYKTPICEAHEYYIHYPTAKLTFDLEFPEGYEIKKPFPDVTVGEARLKAEAELHRIKEGNFFTSQKMFDKWVLKLDIPKPMYGHRYVTFYEPPRNTELK